MPWSSRDRARKLRAEKLKRIQEQIATGALVIRQMTDSERAAWVRERDERDARMTSTERARRDALLRERGRRAAFSAADLP